jgi:hypothetical protein
MKSTPLLAEPNKPLIFCHCNAPLCRYSEEQYVASMLHYREKYPDNYEVLKNDYDVSKIEQYISDNDESDDSVLFGSESD